MKLVDSVVRTFRVAKTHKENTDKINFMSYSNDGNTLISSSLDDSIVLYDCQNGAPKRTLHSKKYGVDLIQFTHAQNTVIHGSTKIDDTIRHLSLQDNKYLTYFKGHTKKVVALSMSPVGNTFLSGSLDKTIRLWNLQSPNCQGMMQLNGRPVAAFDPEGLIFAVGIDSECIKLYDVRSYEKGPFATFQMQRDINCDWTGLKFSPDGKLILISTDGNSIHLVDAFNGTNLQTFLTPNNNAGIPVEASFSPDSQFIFCGSSDGRIYVWNTDTGNKIVALNGEHTGPVQCVLFNPKFMMLASACNNMVFWIPQID